MKLLHMGSISKKLALLILLAVLPALVILLYSGIEQRRHSIASAKQDVLLLTKTMAQAQKEIAGATRQILSTLTLLPAIQALNIQGSAEILQAVMEKNPSYNNILLVNLDGEVLAAGRTFPSNNLADRKHVRQALERKGFAAGEYIVSRGEVAEPLFAFAYPVMDKEGNAKGVLAMSLTLTTFSRFHNLKSLPEKSFVAITDHQGIRLFYYPSQASTNPVGKPIKAKSWQMARDAKEPGIFIGRGSDGRRRIFAFEQVRLASDESPYLYVWAGMPEAYILAPANAALTRNLLLMLLAAALALGLAWLMGKKTLLSPIHDLVRLTKKFAQGDLAARSEFSQQSDEFGVLTTAFHDMADALATNQRTLRENEARFRLLLDSLDAVVYVADMDTYEVLFINEYGKRQFGDIVGKICWQSLQSGQEGPCPFCPNKYLLNDDGNPGDVYTWEFQNTVTGKWTHIIDRAIVWADGRIVRLEIATDISDRKKEELIQNALIEKLEKALAEIKTLQGILPICSICKNVRNDEGYYEKIESYIHKHSGVDFSHTICPICLKKHYPEEYEILASKGKV